MAEAPIFGGGGVHRLALALALVAMLTVSCSGGGGSGGSTPTPPAVAGVQERALKALPELSSGIVHVTGRASQGDQSADFTIEYRSAADRFAYRAQSTFQGKPADIQVLGIGASAWTFENGGWQPLPAGVSWDNFKAQRIWSFAPFPSATPVGIEQVSGVAATHFRYDGPAQLAFGELAGSLIASGDVAFSGALDHVTVDYWVALAGGYPVKATYRATGDGTLEMTAELTNINDPAVA